MKPAAIIGVAAAIALAGCSMQTETVEESTSPAPWRPPLTYDAHNMAEFDAAMIAADDYCYKENDLKRARYADRTFEAARFECVER
jgi:hypothetical protein